MKIRSTITKAIAMAAMVTAIVIIGAASTAQAQHVKVVDGRGYGYLIPETTLRFSVINMVTAEPGKGAIRVQVILYGAEGNVLARSQVLQLSPGEFRIIDFRYQDLATTGDAGNTRIQVRSGVQVLMSDGSVRDPSDQISVYACKRRR